LKTLQDLWEFLGIVAVPLIDIVIERHVPVQDTKKGIDDLAKVAPALLVLSSLCHLAAHVERVDERIKVGAVIVCLI
jgi:hypothetical protein